MFKCPHCDHGSRTVDIAWDHWQQRHRAERERKGLCNWPDHAEVWTGLTTLRSGRGWMHDRTPEYRV